MGVQIADLSSGAQNAIIGILAALHHRTVSGVGQYLDISMTDGAQALHGLFGAAYLVDEKEPAREETILNGGSIYDFYETEDGRYLSFGALEPGFFNACCNAMGCSGLACEGVAPVDNAKNKNEIKRVFKTKTLAEWIELFAGVDACIEPVLTMNEVAADEQTKAREMIVDVPLPNGKKVRQFANPIKFSATPPQYKFTGLPAGMHTQEIMQELGYNEKEIEEFKKSGLFD
jgi:alpha-methylacyl-CoA racemase